MDAQSFSFSQSALEGLLQLAAASSTLPSTGAHPEEPLSTLMLTEPQHLRTDIPTLPGAHDLGDITLSGTGGIEHLSRACATVNGPSAPAARAASGGSSAMLTEVRPEGVAADDNTASSPLSYEIPFMLCFQRFVFYLSQLPECVGFCKCAAPAPQPAADRQLQPQSCLTCGANYSLSTILPPAAYEQLASWLLVNQQLRAGAQFAGMGAAGERGNAGGRKKCTQMPDSVVEAYCSAHSPELAAQPSADGDAEQVDARGIASGEEDETSLEEATNKEHPAAGHVPGFSTGRLGSKRRRRSTGPGDDTPAATAKRVAASARALPRFARRSRETLNKYIPECVAGRGNVVFGTAATSGDLPLPRVSWCTRAPSTLAYRGVKKPGTARFPVVAPISVCSSWQLPATNVCSQPHRGVVVLCVVGAHPPAGAASRWKCRSEASEVFSRRKQQ